MSFSLKQTEVKKDEEEFLAAREGDPLLPTAGGRGTTPNSFSSIRDNTTATSNNKNTSNNNNNNNNSNNSKSNSLRVRRSSRSPSSQLEHTSGSGTPQSNLGTASTHSAATAAKAALSRLSFSGGSSKPPPTTRKGGVNSQMINADDESSKTRSSALLDAAAAAAEAASLPSFVPKYEQHQDSTTTTAHRYIDFSELNQLGDIGASGSLDSSRLRSSERMTAQQHQQQHRVTPTSGMAPYEPPSYRPPSPDEGGRTDARSTGSGSQSQPPLLEIPEEIYAVRKAALKVLKPLTKTWIVISVGFSLSALFGAARWTLLLPTVPYWFILLPCWLSHVGLLWLHVLSAKALSNFIAEANDGRQRPDSRDHLNRTEYLPLLQRSLKFGLKTGILSFFVFIFEILIFIRLSRGSITLTAAFVPLWVLIVGCIIDGLVCKTQHFLRLFCWILAFTAMTLAVLKVDYGHDEIRWRLVVCPVVAALTIASGSLIYIVYGHQIGFYRLTDSQLTAGNLYAIAALICIILVFMIGEVIPLSRPVEVETKLFIVVLAPLVVCLVGMGAWVVSRDEFSRLLLYGGQSAVHPKKLRWVARDGWTCVQGKGVTVIPMLGEVNFRPLERKSSSALKSASLELCICCSKDGRGCCYLYEEEEDDEEGGAVAAGDGGGANTPSLYHPYLDSSVPRSSSSTRGGGGGDRNLISYNNNNSALRGL